MKTAIETMHNARSQCTVTSTGFVSYDHPKKTLDISTTSHLTDQTRLTSKHNRQQLRDA